MRVFVGVDPGKAGGIAAVNEFGIPVASVKMPATDRDVLDTFRHFATLGECRAVLEFVRSSPQMGVVSAFTFGCGYGGLRMALAAAGIPFTECVPRKWQGKLGCLSKQNKNVTKAKAQQLFPSVPVTHAIADALLIAEYCRVTEEGGRSWPETAADRSRRVKGKGSRRQPATELF